MYHIMKYVLYIISVFFLITAYKMEKIEVNPSQEEEKKELRRLFSYILIDFGKRENALQFFSLIC